MPDSFTVKYDTTPLRVFLSELSTELSELVELPLQVSERFRELCGIPGGLIRSESCAAGTALKIILHPSERLLELVATIRTGNF